MSIDQSNQNDDSERDTVPDLLPKRQDTAPDLTLAAKNARESVKTIEKRELPQDFDSISRDEQIMALIRKEDDIDEENLNTFCRTIADGKLTLLQYWLEGTQISFVYIDKGHHEPSYRDTEPRWDVATKRFTRDLIELPKLDVTVLFKIENGIAHQLHRWHDGVEEKVQTSGVEERVESELELPSIIINTNEDKVN